MEALILKATDDTPDVNFDSIKGFFEISGKSMPEDVSMFYDPILIWLDKYAESPNNTTVLNVKMDYFNTASSKLLLDVLLKFEEIHQQGNAVLIKWYYFKTDEEMKDAGEEYADIIDVPFEYIRV